MNMAKVPFSLGRNFAAFNFSEHLVRKLIDWTCD